MDCFENLTSRLAKCSGFGLLMSAICGFLFTLSNFMAQLSMTVGFISPSDKNSLLNLNGSNMTRKNNNTMKNEMIPALEVVFFRCGVQLLLLIPVIVSCEIKILVDRHSILSATSMALSGYFIIVLSFLSYERMPLSDALVISFTSPVFAAIFSQIILNEKCGILDAVCGLISFTGVILVARPKFIFGKNVQNQSWSTYINAGAKESEISYSVGAGFALLNGICLAFYFVVARKFAKESNKMVNILYPSVTGVVLSPIIAYGFNETFILPHSMTSALCMVSVGVFSIMALTTLVVALQKENPTYVTVIRNLDVIYSLILQYISMGIKPSVWSIGGGGVIMCATTVMAVHRHLLRNTRNGQGEYEQL